MGKITRGNTAYMEPVSISSFNQGKAKQIFEDAIAVGTKVVLKNNKRIAMIVSPSRYDEMVEKLEDCELLFKAMTRTETNEKIAVSMSDVMKRFGITQEDLDDTDVDIDI